MDAQFPTRLLFLTHKHTLLCHSLRSSQLLIKAFQLAILIAMPLGMSWFVDTKPRGSRLRTTSASSGSRGTLSNTTYQKQGLRMAWRATAPLLFLVFSLTLLSRVGLVASTDVCYTAGLVE